MPKGVYIRTKKTKKKISETRKKMWRLGKIKGHKHSKETKRKISEARLKRKTRLGYLNSSETRKKISEILKGKRYTEERKRRMSEAHKGKKRLPHSEEAKRKMSKARKGKYMGAKHPNWKGGISFEPYSPAWTEELKQAIRQRDNFVCQVCGKYPAFYIHHIDYNKKNCEPDNLITLCNSCHSITNFNREYWIKFFKQIKPLIEEIEREIKETENETKKENQ